MASDRTVKVSLTAQVTQYLEGMEKARKATSASGTAAEKATRQLEAQSKAMDFAGKGLMAAGTVAVAATALAVKAAIDWESAWAGVTKTVDGTPAELQKVEDGLRSLAKTLPSTHDEIAGVAEAAGQLGVARKDVVGFTNTMIDLSETTNLSADDAATSIAQISNVMGTMKRDGAEGVERFGATLVALGNAGASTEAEILEMAKRIAGAAKLVGASESNVLALSNAMASVGIEAQLGGGVMSRVMQRMYGDVMAGGESLETLAKVSGVSAKEFATAFETDPIRAVDMMVKGLGRVKDEGGNVVETMADLGVKGTEETGVILRLAGAGDLLADSLKLGDEAWESNSALAAEAAKRYATVEAQLQITANKVTDAAISFGDVFLPAVSAASGGVGDLADTLGGLDPIAQGIIATVALVTGGVALAGGAFLVAVPKVVAYRAAVEDLGPAGQRTAGILGKVGKAIGAIAVVGAAVTALGVFNEAMRDTGKTGEELANTLLTAKDGAQIVSDSFADVKANWVGSGVDSIFDDFGGTIDSTFEAWDTRWAGFGRDLIGARPMSDDVRDSLAKLGTEFGDLATTNLPAAQKAMRQVVDQYGLSEEQLWRLIDMSPDYKAALTDQASELGIAANRTNLLNIATEEAAPVTETAAEAYLLAADEASGLNDELLTLIDSMNEVNGTGQNASSANIAYQQSLADIDEQIRLVNEGAEGYAQTLDIATEAGRSNRGMLDELAASSQEAALKQFELDGNTENYRATLEAGHQAVYDRAVALGANADEAKRIADEIAKIPSAKEFEIIANTDAANAALDQLAARIAAGQPVAYGAGYVRAQADGGVMDFYANGGVREDHVAQIAPAGAWRVWAEPETGGEVYIPLAASKRAQSLDIWREAGSRLGVKGFSGGGFTGYATQPQYVQSSHYSGGASSTSTSTTDARTYVTAIGPDANEVASKVQAKQDWARRNKR